MLLKLYRTLKSGVHNFWRNGLLSVATISVIVITLFIINLQTAQITANDLLLKDVEGKVSISVYFQPDATESNVLNVKDEFSRYKEISSIEYISKDQALTNFKERNKDNETIKKSIDEIGGNPLGATLNIKAKNPDDYELIAKSVEESKFKEIISKVNYHKYKAIIDNLNSEIKSNQRVALILGITLSIIAVLITFNSIRITMYAHRQEIEIMRLVGASNIYISLPFIWEGIIYGFFAAILTIPMVYGYLVFVSKGGSSGSIVQLSNNLYLGKFLSDYFLHHIVLAFFLEVFIGILLGVVSSLIAIRKYLKV